VPTGQRCNDEGGTDLRGAMGLSEAARIGAHLGRPLEPAATASIRCLQTLGAKSRWHRVSAARPNVQGSFSALKR